MGEIIRFDFQRKNPSQEDPKKQYRSNDVREDAQETMPDADAGVEDSGESGEGSERRRRTLAIMRGVGDSAWGDFMQIAKTIGDDFSQSVFQEQHDHVSRWSDEEVINFLRDDEARRKLLSKPALAVALLGRVLGEY